MAFNSVRNNYYNGTARGYGASSYSIKPVYPVREQARSWEMKLKFNGKCAACGAAIYAGESAIYDSATKTVWDSECYPANVDEFIAAKPVEVKVATVAPVTVEVKTEIKDGTYTVVDGNEHRTLRIKSVEMTDKYNGSVSKKRIVSYLSGSDNETSYTGFAFLEAAGFKVWKKFGNGGEMLKAALQVLADPASAGEKYAMESGKCFCCGKKLTVPASLHRGLGPICAGKQ